MKFADRYRQVIESLVRPLTPADGVSIEVIEESEQRNGYRLPAALREYYLVAGRFEAMNTAMDHLATPYPPTKERYGRFEWWVAKDSPVEPSTCEEMKIPEFPECESHFHDMIGFLGENQHVCFWGFKALQNPIDDPPVYQGETWDGFWYPDSPRLSDFLIGTVHWQVAEMWGKKRARWGDLSTEGMSRFQAGVPFFTGRQGLLVYGRSGQVFCAWRAGDGYSYIGSGKTRDDLRILRKLMFELGAGPGNTLKTYLLRYLRELRALSPEALLEDRYQKFRRMGVFETDAGAPGNVQQSSG